MAEVDLDAVLDRIGAALARLERIEPRDVPHSNLAEAYALLDERHGLLRLRIQETIDRLDALVAKPDGFIA
ncbi:hypothetical protein FHS31_002530 [Sphingomonas vulcanisoli]|uniref:Uncharacterized protein n=1 Tax=Sphingomonas vulcanisoli TaxID=1658060 RepID=A0ABX0TZ39_9SPHN|nr:hypothetical protein [Sphingomonas vulcanisoli]NIJ08906.1 hypothetical protein [Sphingomonas vulcanisoli]